MALCLCAACSSDDDGGDSDATLSASSLNGTTWSGTVTLDQTSIPLTLSFTSETNVTIGVYNGALTVTCTYEISDSAIVAKGYKSSEENATDWSGNDITFDVTSYTGSRLVVTVTSSSGSAFSMITTGTSITFTKSN